MENLNGFISLHRKILENPISRKPNYFSVWMFILLNANFKDTSLIIKNEKVVVKRGSYYGSINKIAQHLGLSRSVVAKIVDYLELDGMLDTDRTSQHTVFKVKNYDEYQDSGHDKNTIRTRREHEPTQINNDNNDNNDNNIDSCVHLAFDLFNDFAESNGLSKAQVLNPKRRTHLKSRLKDCGGIDGWKTALEKMAKSDFLMGKTTEWKANLDFMLQQSSFIKIMEGAYDNNKKGGVDWNRV